MSMLIVITTEENFAEEHEQLNALFQLGMAYLHVRKPGFSIVEMQAWLSQFSAEDRSKMVLHQHHELMETFALRGIHFKEAYRKSAEHNLKNQETYLRRHTKTCSASFHDRQKAEDQEIFDYALLSPVFTSLSKMNYTGTYDRVSLAKKPVIALGGVTVANMEEAKLLGYAGVAVLGSVWQAGNPLESFMKIKQTYEKLYS